ncbi:thiamine pyrophosphate-binding protein, partial [Cohnella sp. REN36]
FSARVERGDLFPIYFKHALERALTGAKGPVHLSIPLDVLLEDVGAFDVLSEQKRFPLTSEGIQAVIPLIEQAQNPVMILGKGVHSAFA